MMKHIIPIGLCGLAICVVGPLAWFTLWALVKAFPAACFIGVTVFAAAALDAAKVNT